MPMDNTDSIFRKLKSRFYAFYKKLTSFSPSSYQSENFVQSLILPILLYNSEILFNSCTVIEQYVTGFFFKNLWLWFFRCDRIFSTAISFCNDKNHTINEHHVPGMRKNLSMKCRTLRIIHQNNAIFQST